MRPNQCDDFVMKRALRHHGTGIPARMSPVTRRSRVGLALLLVATIVVPARAVPPLNDTCVGAEVIPSSAQFPYYTAVTDVTDATSVGDPVASCTFGNPFSHSIWYTFTPASTAFYTISSCADAPTATKVPDTLIAIYTSNAGCAGATNEVPSGAAGIGSVDGDQRVWHFGGC